MQLLAFGSCDQTVRLWGTATGALHETMSIDKMVTDLKFPQDGSFLITNFQARCGNYVSDSPKTGLEIRIQRGNWIALNMKQILWLPPEARPSCSAIKANTLALGHPSGRISFIAFREKLGVKDFYSSSSLYFFVSLQKEALEEAENLYGRMFS
ncbi:hypothetical protein BJX63DRAFT_417111 [Aspergillus granulosus]|uniref:Uncharacterized protein n=1 Tax=Aspergillus granulosus TaxID=176169 RepID=A0ABR4GRQ0_9EURO